MPLVTSNRPRKARIQKSPDALWHTAILSDGLWYTNCGFCWSKIHLEMPIDTPERNLPPTSHFCSNCDKGD